MLDEPDMVEPGITLRLVRSMQESPLFGPMVSMLIALPVAQIARSLRRGPRPVRLCFVNNNMWGDVQPYTRKRSVRRDSRGPITGTSNDGSAINPTMRRDEIRRLLGLSVNRRSRSTVP